jgi:DNA replication protein DnaC
VASCRASEDEILLAIKSTFGSDASDTENNVYKKFAAAAPLIIDDIGVARVTDFTFDVWENIIGRRYRENAPTLITSNYSIDGLEKRIGVRVTERIRESKMIYEYIGENRRRV